MLDNKFNGTALTKEAKEYLRYIDEHRRNVMKACKAIGAPLCKALHITMESLENVVVVHDLSKYSPEEFEPYRQKFYPYKGAKPDEALFDLGWRHHYAVNNHHPEHWVGVDDKGMKMDALAIAEMFCDWVGMGYKFGTKTVEWYTDKMKREPFKFHPETKETVEKILRMGFIP